MTCDARVLATGFVALDVIRSDFGHTVEFAAGGSCGNVSANLADLGVTVVLLARIGTDEEGDAVQRDLSARGVNLGRLQRSAGIQTPVVIHEILERQRGLGDHRFLLKSPRSGERLPRYSSITDAQADDVIHSALRPRILYVDRLSSAVARIVTWAHETGCLVFYEPSDPRDANHFGEIESQIDVLKYSHERSAGFGGSLQRLEAPFKVVTAGPAGIAFSARQDGCDTESFTLPAFAASHVVDTAGSGDAVSASLIRQIVSSGSESFPDLGTMLGGLRQGQRLAAINCGYAGARGVFRKFGPEVSTLLEEGEHHLVGMPTARAPTRSTFGQLEARYG